MTRRRDNAVEDTDWLERRRNDALPECKDQRHDLRWNAKPDMVWSPGQIPETGYPVLLIALLPDIEERPQYRKKTGRSG